MFISALKSSSSISISQYTRNNPKSFFHNLQISSKNKDHRYLATTTMKQSYYCVEGPMSGTDGYFYQQYYNEENCEGSLTFTEGLYGDYCSPDNMGAYYKLSFSDGILLMIIIILFVLLILLLYYFYAYYCFNELYIFTSIIMIFAYY